MSRNDFVNRASVDFKRSEDVQKRERECQIRMEELKRHQERRAQERARLVDEKKRVSERNLLSLSTSIMRVLHA